MGHCIVTQLQQDSQYLVFPLVCGLPSLRFQLNHAVLRLDSLSQSGPLVKSNLVTHGRFILLSQHKKNLQVVFMLIFGSVQSTFRYHELQSIEVMAVCRHKHDFSMINESFGSCLQHQFFSLWRAADSLDCSLIPMRYLWPIMQLEINHVQYCKCHLMRSDTQMGLSLLCYLSVIFRSLSYMYIFQELAIVLFPYEPSNGPSFQQFLPIVYPLMAYFPIPVLPSHFSLLSYFCPSITLYSFSLSQGDFLNSQFFTLCITSVVIPIAAC